jgi:hypothetical protein
MEKERASQIQKDPEGSAPPQVLALKKKEKT